MQHFHVGRVQRVVRLLLARSREQGWLALVNRCFLLHLLILLKASRYLTSVMHCETLLLKLGVYWQVLLLLHHGCFWLKTHVKLLLGLRDRMLWDWEVGPVEHISCSLICGPHCAKLHLVSHIVRTCKWIRSLCVTISDLLIHRCLQRIVFSDRHLVHDWGIDSLLGDLHSRNLSRKWIHHDWRLLSRSPICCRKT